MAGEGSFGEGFVTVEFLVYFHVCRSFFVFVFLAMMCA